MTRKSCKRDYAQCGAGTKSINRPVGGLTHLYTTQSQRRPSPLSIFVINMLYISHSAATKPNDTIDLNAQVDLDLMTRLPRTDALVSNETGLLRKAFDDMWRPRGKSCSVHGCLSTTLPSSDAI